VGLVGQTLTINGTGFSATNNEVWFANQLVTAPATAALVKATAVASTGGGTQIVLTLPGLRRARRRAGQELGHGQLGPVERLPRSTDKA
jgi:hypothetical protein